MRQGAEWLIRGTDDRILEVLRDEGNMTPVTVSRDGEIPRVDIGRQHASDRLAELARYGLIERIGARGLYRLTEKGRAYLDEELDASVLEPIDAKRDGENENAVHES